MKPIIKHVLATSAAWLAGTVAVAVAFIWSGAYDVGADAPHAALVHALLDTTVERSIAVRASHLNPPDLSHPARIAQGAGNYDAMCAQCHLAPGREQTELSQGLYPSPPGLSEYKVDPARAFWVIKHGIKASGMPAWGRHMDDASIWNVVAFLQKLPGMHPPQYEEMVAESGGHSHGSGDSGSHSEHDEKTAKDGQESARQVRDNPLASPTPDPKQHDRHRHRN